VCLQVFLFLFRAEAGREWEISYGKDSF
jgi:hypothetical protein